VYDAAHLGHARTYVSLDLLRRAATRFLGIPVRFLMGVTDIDDKIIARAGRDGDPAKLAQEQEESFFRSMARLGVQPPDRLLRVTEHIDQISGFISQLEAAGFAYVIEPKLETGAEPRPATDTPPAGVYFSVSALEEAGLTYGRLQPQPPAEAASSGKRDPRDFALWKAAKAGEPVWQSPWGPGRPGWHIECSAMTLAAGGSRLDLHAGGSDLCFPHHVNEMAQSEALLFATERASGSPAPEPTSAGPREWVRLWVHPGPLTIRGLKMSKSLKNFVTVDQLLDSAAPGAGTELSVLLRGADPADVFRLFCMQHPYRSPVGFSEGALQAAAALLRKWSQFVLDANAATARSGSAATAHEESDLARDCSVAAAALRTDVGECLSQDLDTPAAVDAVSRCVSAGRAVLEAHDPTPSQPVSPSPSSSTRGDTDRHWDPFPVYRCAEEVVRVARDLGLSSLPRVVSPHELAMPPGSSVASSRPESEAWTRLSQTSAVLSAVRAAVRAEALTVMRSSETEKQAKRLANRLLRLSDAVRDEVLPAFAPWVNARDATSGKASTGGASAESQVLSMLHAALENSGTTKPKEADRTSASDSMAAPDRLFLQPELYGSWDSDGIPITSADGTELSRSQRNKLRSKQKRYSSAWSRQQAKQ
jgi:cysteinyl-tRNA synthetase